MGEVSLYPISGYSRIPFDARCVAEDPAHVGAFPQKPEVVEDSGTRGGEGVCQKRSGLLAV